MIKDISPLHRQFQKFKNFYVHHTSRSWQSRLASGAILLSAVGLLLAAVSYGIIFLHSGSRAAGARAIEFAAAKIIVTILLILDNKRIISYGGPALIGVYLALGAVLAIGGTGSRDIVAVTMLSLAPLLSGVLYGFWCSLVPASLASATLIGIFANQLQVAVQDGRTMHTPTVHSGGLVLAIHTLFGCGLVGAGLHTYLNHRAAQNGAPNGGGNGAAAGQTPAVPTRPQALLIGKYSNILQNELAGTFDLTVAPTGAEGLQLSRSGVYQLAVIDLPLPDMSGYTICQTLRDTDEHFPILALAERADKKTQLALLEAGADDYVLKPADTSKLAARMNALVRLSGLAEQPILYTHDLVIDTRKRQVTRGEADIQLRRKEYEILEYLTKHKGQVATKAMLFKHIWYKEVQPDSLGVHMKHLRDKVDRPFDTPLIDTLHGVGYLVKDLPGSPVDPPAAQ